MKIAHIIPHFFPDIGGLQVCVHNIAEIHNRQGLEVVIFTYNSPPPGLKTSYIIKKMPAFKFITKGYPISKYLITLYFLMLQKKHHFDLWQVDGGYPYGVLLVDFFNQYNIPCILRSSGDDIQVSEEFQYGVRRNAKIDRLIRKSYCKFDAAIAISETVKQEYLSIGVPENKIEIIPNGVDLENIHNFQVTENIRKTHNIDDDTKIILTVGRNHPKKGYELIPDIFKKIYRERKDIVWIVIGKECSKINSSGLNNELNERFILLDELTYNSNGILQKLPPEELINYYRAADLFVFPSYIETFGIVLIEAIAAGLPVVTSDAPGCRDIIKNGYNGLLAETGNSEMLARKTLNLLNDKNLYNQICSNISIDIKMYDWQIIAQKYRELYKKIINKKKSTRI